MNKITLFFAFVMTLGVVNAQSLEEELGFIYVKADYLLETDRYEDAIFEFTKIIDKDPAFKDALYKRSLAKYAIAAYLGTKKDLLKAFEFVGVTPEALVLYGKTLKNLDEHDAATITQKTASMLNGGGSSHAGSGKKTKSDNSRNNDTNGGGSSEQGNTEREKTPEEILKEEAQKIDDKVGSILDDILGREESSDNGGSTTQTDTGTDTNTTENGEDTGTVIDIIKKQEEPEVEVEPEYVPDMSVNELFIDEDLTIFIQDGLGGRKVLNQPNILILNETSGNISIDVCVNENGKVTDAEFNKNASSLSTQSLVSLAVRKSKEFWFEKSTQDEICGTFIFKISGRN